MESVLSEDPSDIVDGIEDHLDTVFDKLESKGREPKIEFNRLRQCLDVNSRRAVAKLFGDLLHLSSRRKVVLEQNDSSLTFGANIFIHRY